MSAAAVVVKPKALNCPNCGAALEVRGFAHTLNVVCPQCLAILDKENETFQIVQKFQGKTRPTLQIPLGARGKWRGVDSEVIGFQVRTITVDGTDYSWEEYLLFNPFHGFHYLTQYNHHWNDITTVRAVPLEGGVIGARPRVVYNGQIYSHFQTSNARVTYVLGEFPWQVRRGDQAKVMDYVNPPGLLSAEQTEDETVWSLGEYVPGAEVFAAFNPKNKAPAPIGIFANQPSPYRGKVGSIWRLYGFLILLTLAAILFVKVASRDREVFKQRFAFVPGTASPSLVTPLFELKDNPKNLEIQIRTNLSNNWAYFNLALINDGTGTAYDFGREVSYYTGRDSDGSWTEGSPGDTVRIPPVPAGRYYLRVEPEMEGGATSMNYEIRIRQDVLSTGWLWLVAGLLLIPPIWVSIRAAAFESQRMQESDYSSSGGSGSDDSGDD